MNPSSILFWNVRGLNMMARRSVVKDVILSSRVDIVCLQETKVAAINQFFLCSVFGSDFDKFVMLPAIGSSGGIIIAWKSVVVQAISSRVDSFSVSV
jgi:exonuclease III